MKKNQQGTRWRRLDNTAKLFPVIANENLSNVFRVSATLKEPVVPELLQQAIEEILPWFEGFRVRLRRGFFWYYFELNKRIPLVEKESTYPCKYIDPRSNQLFLFRVSYFERRINLEVFHAVTDGLGAVHFLRELTYRYLQLVKHQSGMEHEGKPSDSCLTGVEDSYLKNYKKTHKRKYSTARAYHLSGEHLPLDAENVIHGCVDLASIKKVCKERNVSLTKYLTACLIWSVYKEYLNSSACEEPIGVNLPINLRSFFNSETTANFFAVTTIDFVSKNQTHTFDEVLDAVSAQMNEKIVREKLEETISYNVSNEKKWYLRITPLFIKWAGMNLIFRKNDRAHTVTLSNIGPIAIDPEYQADIEQFHLIIGVSQRQNMKCGVCAYKEKLMVSFNSVFADSRLQDCFFGTLRDHGIQAELESNGIVPGYDKKMYPIIQYDVNKWKKTVNIFYAVLVALAAILGVVNIATYSGFWWSGIAIASIFYTALTVRYSIMRHANLGSKIMIQTLGAQALLVVIDHLTGYRGWSVNYAIPSTILFADLAIVFLIIVNRLNWQSYLMYQISITIFSFIPLILWAAGWITNPVMAIITVIISVLILTVVVLMGDRSVKNELIRRFHL